MKIVAISDTHNQISKMDIPDGDVLVHAGDATGQGMDWELIKFNDEFGALPHKHKIFIPGNHDFICQENEHVARLIMSKATMLIDEEIVIDGVKFYGSPWQPWFYDWAFNLPRGSTIAEKWAKIPEDTDVLITHGPPKGQNDLVTYGMVEVGCADLRDRVFQVKPQYHIFGHIHEAYGMSTKDGVTFVNAASVTLGYQVGNPPFVLEFER